MTARLAVQSRAQLVSTGKNLVLKERYESRLYKLPSGRMVTVRTLSEMEREESRAEKQESNMERDRR